MHLTSPPFAFFHCSALLLSPSCRWRGSLFVHVRHAAREALKKVSTISRQNRNAHKGVSHSDLCQILGVKLAKISTSLTTTPPQHLHKFYKCMSHVYRAFGHVSTYLYNYLLSTQKYKTAFLTSQNTVLPSSPPQLAQNTPCMRVNFTGLH